MRKKNKRVERIEVRLTEKEKEDFLRLAAVREMTISEYIRWRILGII